MEAEDMKTIKAKTNTPVQNHSGDPVLVFLPYHVANLQ